MAGYDAGVGRSEFTLAELKTAFELRIVHMVMTADEIVHRGEMDFLEGVFPPDEIDAHGFLDRTENRFTRRFGKAVQAAPEALSQWLSADEKLDMLRLFFKACEADGEVDPRELSVIVQAARMLGLSQEELVPHLSRMVGSRATPRAAGSRRSSPARRSTVEPLVTTQDGMHAALHGTGTPGETALVLRQRLDEVLRSDSASITLIVTPLGAQERRTHGLEALVQFCAHHGTLVLLAGRLDLAFDAWDGESRPPSELPELRELLRNVADQYPWLPAWLVPTSGVAAQLVASCIPVDVEHEDYPTYFLALAIEAANWAVALTRKLGGAQLDHVYEYLAELGMVDVPAGSFDGVEPLAARLDPWGRAV